VPLRSRLLLGTAGYPSPEVLARALAASGAQVLTVGLKRTLAGGDNGFVAGLRAHLREHGGHLLPNTAGCRSAREAIALARMARELYDTAWIKLEVVGDEHTLQPDPGSWCRRPRRWCAKASRSSPTAPTTWWAASASWTWAARC
jgi:thiazole synthase